MYNGTLETGCASDYVKCAGVDVLSPLAMWNTRPSPARDEGAGTMEDREEWRSQILIAVLDAMRSWRGHTPERVAIEITEAVIALAAPVSAPGMGREAVARIIDPDAWAEIDRRQALHADPLYRSEYERRNLTVGFVPASWERIRSRLAAPSLATADQIIALQSGSEPADGSQVEPSTTGAGRHIPLEPNPFIQWNGGENPAPGKVVKVRYRGGAVYDGPSDTFSWALERSVYDIIAYRIIPTDDQGGEG